MKNDVLKNKNFLLLLLGKFISLVGDEFQDFALSLYVLEITGSAVKFASVLAVATIPKVIFGPICGVFSDWFDKKKLMILLNCISGVVVASMGVLYKVNGRISLGYIYFAVIILAIISMFYSSTTISVVPSIVEKDKLLKANSLNSTVSSIPQIAGPLLSGIVFAFFGIFYIIVINSISFFITALTICFMKIPRNERENIKFDFNQFKKDFAEGFIYIKNDRIFSKITLCCIVLNFTVNTILYIGPRYICKEVLNVSDGVIGILQAIFTSGVLIGSIIPGLFKRKVNPVKAFGVSMSANGILFMVFSAVVALIYGKVLRNANLAVGLISILLTIIVIFIITANIFSATVFQAQAPKGMLGRLGGVIGALCIAPKPFGDIILGGMFGYTKAYVPLALSGAIMIIFSIYFLISQRKLIQEKIKDKQSAVN